MQVSKKRVSRKLISQFHRLLEQVIADIHRPKEAQEFFKDFLSKTELEILTRRLGIAYYLDKNHSYQTIKNKLGVSSATIATVNEQMRKNGFQIAMEKIKADEWASRWAKKIGQALGKR